jgi:K+-transporting ATPase ATPase C chain
MKNHRIGYSTVIGRRLAFEVASLLTEGVAILIGVARRVYAVTAFTIVTTAIFGLGYPLLVTAAAQLFFPVQANGSLVERDGRPVGSALIAQPFAGPGYFWPRPSAAGEGYDGAASGGSNLGPTSAALVSRVAAARARLASGNPGVPVPIELVTTSASGLDPHLSPAGALFQAARVARERGMDETAVRDLIARMTEPRQFGVLGEPRVNVLLLNLALDERYPGSAKR